MNSSAVVSRRSALGGLTAGLAAAAAFGAGTAEARTDDDKNVAQVKALLQQHDKAFTAKDLDGVMKLYAAGPKTVVIGTGPGEIWSGKDEIKTAYQHFVEDFDVGKQDFEYGFVTGDIVGDGAWLVATGKLKLTKGSDHHEVGLNASITFIKTGGSWYINSFHFSSLFAGAAAQKG